jgi:HD-GYP domain-containing protein (c-di-GMP phosphodiesterase class II)
MIEKTSSRDLDAQLCATLSELKFTPEEKTSIFSLLQPLKEKSPVHKLHYEYSIKVGFLCKNIARSTGLDEKELFLDGILHDVGKQYVGTEILGKKEPLTQEEMEEIRQHVVMGYELVKDKFSLTAKIISTHHEFQESSYPKKLPFSVDDYSSEEKSLILRYGRVLALADVYDALHRESNKFGERRQLTKDEIREKMFTHNSDCRGLVRKLYRKNIFR